MLSLSLYSCKHMQFLVNFLQTVLNPIEGSFFIRRTIQEQVGCQNNPSPHSKVCETEWI